jgi:hypothetical protein
LLDKDGILDLGKVDSRKNTGSPAHALFACDRLEEREIQEIVIGVSCH